MFRKKRKGKNCLKEQEERILNELDKWVIGSQQYEDALEQHIKLVKGKVEIEKEKYEKYLIKTELLFRLLSFGSGLAFSLVFMSKSFKFEDPDC